MNKSINHKVTIFALALVIFIDSLTIGLVMPLFAALFNDPQGILPAGTSLASRNLMYSLIISLPMFALLFGSPILGELSDRWGRKLVLLVSLLGVFLSCLLSVFSFYISSIVLLFISRILVALMDGSQSIAQAAIVDISFPEEKVKNLSLITLAATLGWTIGPVAGGVLSDPHVCSWFNYKLPFWVSAIFALANFVMLKYTFTETRVKKEVHKKSFFMIFIGLAKSFFDRRYIILSIALILMQFGWSGYYQAINMLLVQKFHYSAAQLGIFSTYMALIFTIFLMLLMRFVLHRFSTINVARVGLLLLSMSLFLSALTVDHIVMIWLLLILLGMGMAMSYNTLLGLLSNAVGDHEQGKVMGISLGLVALAWLFSGLFTGHASSVSYPLTFTVDAIGVGLGFLLLLKYREKNHEHN